MLTKHDNQIQNIKMFKWEKKWRRQKQRRNKEKNNNIQLFCLMYVCACMYVRLWIWFHSFGMLFSSFINLFCRCFLLFSFNLRCLMQNTWKQIQAHMLIQRWIHSHILSLYNSHFQFSLSSSSSIFSMCVYASSANTVVRECLIPLNTLLLVNISSPWSLLSSQSCSM